jgi:hypothetical protein
MTRRYYTNAAPQLTTTGSINAAAVSVTLSPGFVGWPASFPYRAVLEYGTGNMEIVLVTAVVGATATITRGQDGTTAVSHNAGATFDQAVTAGDFDEANAHVNGTSGVHGVTGSVVGTTDAQTLTNKTLTAPAISNPSFSGTGDALALSGALTSASVSTGGVAATSVASTGAVSGTAFTGTSFAGGIVTPKAYTNQATRDAAIPSPTAGTICYLSAPTGGALAGLYVYNGAAWRWIDDTSDDTGWVTGATAISNLGWSTDPAWGSASVKYRRRGGLLTLVATQTKTGVVNTGDTGTFGTIGTSTFRPPGDGASSNTQFAPYYITAAGVVKFAPAWAGAFSGVTQTVTFTYFL